MRAPWLPSRRNRRDLPKVAQGPGSASPRNLHERQLERSLHLVRGLMVEIERLAVGAIKLVDNALNRN